MSALSFFLSACCSQAWGYHTWKSYPLNSWDYELQLRSFQATANYLSQGNLFERLPSGQSYRVTHVEPRVRWHLRRWALFSELQFGSAQSQNLNETRTNSGLSQILLGTDFILYQGRFALLPEFRLEVPLQRNSVDSDATSLGEGALQLSARWIAQAHFWRIRWASFLGFVYRDGGRSALMPWGLMTEFQFRKFVLGNEIQVFQSVSLDSDTGTRESARREWANRVNAGSQRYFSVNPNWSENTTWARFVVDRSLWMQAGAGFTLNGSNSGAGWNAFVGLLYRSRPPTPRASDRLESFQIQTEDGVSQDLFGPGTLD